MAQGSRSGVERGSKRKVHGPGYLVLWDAHAGDAETEDRIRRFLIGDEVPVRDGDGPRQGFAGKDGVRCVAPTVFFVKPSRLAEIRRFLRENGIDHEVDPVVFT